MNIIDKVRFVRIKTSQWICIFSLNLLHRYRKKRECSLSDIKRILILRLDKLGDIVLTFPALSALRSQYPDATISLLIHRDYRLFFNTLLDVDEIIDTDVPWNRDEFKGTGTSAVFRLGKKLRHRSFDMAIDFRGDSRHIAIALIANVPCIVSHTSGIFASRRFIPVQRMGRFITIPVYPVKGKHVVEINDAVLSAIGIQINKCYKLQGDIETIDHVSQLLENHGIAKSDRLIVIHPGTGYVLKNWPIDRFAGLSAALLNANNFKLVITGSPSEIPLQNQLIDSIQSDRIIGLAGMLDFHQLGALLQRCSLLIAADTSIVHIASLCKTPTVALYGPGDSIMWGPYQNPESIVIKKQGPCPVCEYRDSCDYQPVATCMNEIQASDVAGAARQLLEADNK